MIRSLLTGSFVDTFPPSTFPPPFPRTISCPKCTRCLSPSIERRACLAIFPSPPIAGQRPLSLFFFFGSSLPFAPIRFFLKEKPRSSFFSAIDHRKKFPCIVTPPPGDFRHVPLLAVWNPGHLPFQTDEASLCLL